MRMDLSQSIAQITSISMRRTGRPSRVRSCCDCQPAYPVSFTDTMDRYSSILYILGRCFQHRGGEPERAKGADGMQLFALDCIAYIVDAETN